VRVLLLDNHDSYTWNLAHLIAQVAGAPPTVCANDAIALGDIAAMNPDAIVISPGPGRPADDRDLGVCADVLRRWTGPLLGVCLGHQAIAWVEGAEIARAPAPMHGRPSPILHDGRGVFREVPPAAPAIRYHSLAAIEPLPPALEIAARSPDGVIMAIRHRSLPWHGVQFHPESIGTATGEAMVRAFLREAAAHSGPRWRDPAPPSSWYAPTIHRPRQRPGADGPVRVAARRLAGAPEPEALFAGAFAGRPGAFWLDSSGRQGANPSRFSYVGAADGPLGRELTWRVGRGAEVRGPDGAISVLTGDPLDALRPPPCRALPDVPFPFLGGFVGFIGHEAARPAPRSAPAVPDGAFAFCDRLVVFDREGGGGWALVFVADGDAAEPALDALAARVALTPAMADPPPAEPGALAPEIERAAYLAAIARAQESILDGESYEICLTQRLVGPPLRDPFAAYRRLRRANPAPYGAFVEIGGAVLLSSSPELFVAADASGQVTARPIKGTTARRNNPTDDARAAGGLAASEKDRAENLMIVDLLRNDLGRVCAWGTVTVPSLMAVESFATVHQLVSTVSGRLAAGRDAIDLIAAAFPPGSMTGAPKERTLELLDGLEASRRGPYGGALGWISIDGAAHLSVVIRTAVQAGGRLEVGVGGAITAMSDAASEWEEAMLKGDALARALYQPISR
jgi:para-aminobenzoate synthetase